MYNGPDDLSQDAFDRSNDQEQNFNDSPHSSDCLIWVKEQCSCEIGKSYRGEELEEEIVLLICGHLGLERHNEFCPRCYVESLEDHNSL